MQLPEILRQLRLRNNYSQEYIADLLKVDYTTYGKYEKGNPNLKLLHAKKLADLYNLTLDEFYNYDPDSQINTKEDKEGDYKKKSNNVLLTITLDGTDESLNKWIKLLQNINQLVKPTI